MPDFTTSSFSLNSSLAYYSVSASYVLTTSNVQTSSYALSASYADRAGIANTASFTISSSYSDYSQFSDTSNTSQTSSFAYISNFSYLTNNANTASYALSSSYSDYASSSLTASYALSSSYSDYASSSLTASYATSSFYAVTASYALNGGGGGNVTNIVFYTIDSTFLQNMSDSGYGTDNLFFIGNNYYQSIVSTNVSNNYAYLIDSGSTTYSTFSFDTTQPVVNITQASDVLGVTASLIQYTSGQQSGQKYVWLSSSASPIPANSTSLKTWTYDNIWYYGSYYTGTRTLPTLSYTTDINNVTSSTLFNLSNGVLSTGIDFNFTFTISSTTPRPITFFPIRFITDPTDLNYKYWKIFLSFFALPNHLQVSATNNMVIITPIDNNSIMNSFFPNIQGFSINSNIVYSYQNTTSGARGGIWTTLTGRKITNPIYPPII